MKWVTLYELSLHSSSCTPLIWPYISDEHYISPSGFLCCSVLSVVYCIKSNNLPSLNCLASPLRWEQGWRCASGPGAPTGTRGSSRAWSRAGQRRGAQQRPKEGGRQVSHPKLATPKFLIRQGGHLLGICKEWPMLSYTTGDAFIVPSVVDTRNTRTSWFTVGTLNALPFLLQIVIIPMLKHGKLSI